MFYLLHLLPNLNDDFSLIPKSFMCFSLDNLKKVKPSSANLLSNMTIAVIVKPTVETIILQMSNSAWLS